MTESSSTVVIINDDFLIREEKVDDVRKFTAEKWKLQKNAFWVSSLSPPIQSRRKKSETS